MRSDFQVRKPTVSVTIGDVAVQVTSLTLYHTINTLPYAEFVVVLDNQPSASGIAQFQGIEININTISQLSKILQEKFYNSFNLKPDVHITLFDDNGDEGSTIDFYGFLSNPSVLIRNGQFLLQFTALHQMAILQAFNPQIYSATYYYAKSENFLEDAFATKPRNDSIADRIAVTVSALMNTYQTNWQSLEDPTALKLDYTLEQANSLQYEPAQWNVHTLNQQVVSILQGVLNDSSALTNIDGLSLNGQENPNFHEAPLHETIMELFINSVNAMEALKNLIQPFIFQLNATWSGKLWMEHLQTLVVPQNMLVVPIEGMSFSLASMMELPLLQVIVRGPGSEMYAGSPISMISSVAPLWPRVADPGPEEFYNATQTGSLLARYPGKIPTKTDGTPVPGRYVYVDAPSWICRDFQVLQPEAIAVKPPEQDALVLNITNQQANEKRYADMSSSRIPFLNYLAQYVFNDNFLRRTSARVKTPLFLKPQVGRTYFVRTMGQDKTILMAYLQSVTHTITLDETGGGAYDTELVFSHVRARDAVLSPISLGRTTNGISDPAVTAQVNAAEAALNKLYAQKLSTTSPTIYQLASAQDNMLKEAQAPSA